MHSAIQSVLTSYGIDFSNCIIEPVNNGLINNTWIAETDKKRYILQKVNKNVFKNPTDISYNLKAIGSFLKERFPDYLFTAPRHSTNNQDLVTEGEEYYRLFDFVEGSNTFQTISDPELAFEAARQFGKFTHLLSGFDANALKNTIPHFHNLALRYKQFETALANAEKDRLLDAAEGIAAIKQQKYIVDEFQRITQSPNFKKRVTHHDTKISNVLFDKNNKGLCVIDLDTVMPGFFISDVGDMFRTYLSPVGEEEKNFDAIIVREDFFDAIVAGYLSEMKSELTEQEMQRFVYAGKFMIYMQAVRFLTDYLNNDIYYGSRYEGHNLLRADNQLYLLKLLTDKESVLLERVQKFL